MNSSVTLAPAQKNIGEFTRALQFPHKFYHFFNKLDFVSPCSVQIKARHGILTNMKSVTLKIWIIWTVVLFAVGLLADYYFLHLLFQEKHQTFKETVLEPQQEAEQNPMVEASASARQDVPEASQDNFLPMLQRCAPEIAAQTISTPEALIEYLRKSVGIRTESQLQDSELQLVLKDGTEVTYKSQDNTVLNLVYRSQGRALTCERQHCRCE